MENKTESVIRTIRINSSPNATKMNEPLSLKGTRKLRHQCSLMSSLSKRLISTMSIVVKKNI